MDQKAQRSALRANIQALEYLISEALASAELLRGAEECGVLSAAADGDTSRPEVLVLRRLLDSVADNLLLRTAACLELGPAKRSIKPLEALERLRYVDRGMQLRAFWEKASRERAALLRNLKVFRDKFLAHYEPGGIRDASLKVLELVPLLQEYLRALNALRLEVFLEEPERAPRPGVRAAAAALLGSLGPRIRGL